jgi:GTP-binding protein
MADGVVLVVDAQEGPMPQTKFVLTKALGLGLKPIVVINKIDKPARRIDGVKSEIEDLFLELAVSDEQLHYPIYYSVSRDGKAWREMPDNPAEHADLSVIFDAIIEQIPAPSAAEGNTQMLVTALQYDSFLGKYAIGKISRGEIRKNQAVKLVKTDGRTITAKVDKIFTYRGLEKEEIEVATTGDIVAVTGLAEARIGDTVADSDNPEALPAIEVEAPTLAIYLGANTSPMKGREGQFTTSRQIGERLQQELETNVALRVEADGIGFKVSGRGELHLSVLIETMRREGYEFEIGRPEVVTIKEDGVIKEPVENCIVEVAPEFVGAVSQEFGVRRGELLRQETTPTNTTRLEYKIPTRGLIGLRNLLLTATKGTVIINSIPSGYEPAGAKLQQTRNGALIAYETGTTTIYALANAEPRGELYVGPGTEVYAGMIVGLHNRQGDLEVNVCKTKHLTNMRSSSSDGTTQLTPYTDLSLEQRIDFIGDDELLEVTPKNLRLRKRQLGALERRRNAKILQ